MKFVSSHLKKKKTAVKISDLTTKIINYKAYTLKQIGQFT